MDGVLIDTEKYLVKFWCQAGREFGYDMKREDALMIRSLAGKYAKPKLQSIYGKDFDYAAVRSRRKELHCATKRSEIREKIFSINSVPVLPRASMQYAWKI